MVFLVGSEKMKINVDLRKPIEYYLNHVCAKYNVATKNEYAFLLQLNSTDMKDFMALKTKTMTMKADKDLTKVKAKASNATENIWLDSKRNFSDEQGISNFTNGVIRLERQIFYNDKIISKHNKDEAAILYPQLKALVAKGHFSSMTDKDYHHLIKMAIMVTPFILIIFNFIF